MEPNDAEDDGRKRVVASRVEGAVGRIHLDDAPHRNALGKDLSDQLAAAVHGVIEAGATAIVLTAEPPVFCAGGSLQSLLDRDVPLGETYAGYRALIHAPIPTIAAVAGKAVGAGVNLPLACDVVIAAESARFDPCFLDAGIHPGGAHLWRLAQRVGVQGAAALTIFGDVLTGAEAESHGLAWRCVPDADLEQVALDLAARVTRRSPALVRRTKQTLRAALSTATFEEAFATELEAQQWSVEQPEFAESVRRIQNGIASRGASGG